MGEIWGNVRLGFAPMQLLATLIGLIIMVIGVFVAGYLIQNIPIVGAVIGAIIVFVLYVFVITFFGNVSVQNITTNKVDIVSAFSTTLNRYVQAILGYLLLGIAVIVAIAIFAVIGLIIGGLLGFSIGSLMMPTTGGIDPFSALGMAGIAGAGAMTGAVLLAIVGLFVIFLGFLPFFSSLNAYIANETTGTIDTLRTAYTKSMAIWPMATGLLVGTVLAGYIPTIVILLIGFGGAIINPYLGLVIMAIGYVIYYSIVINVAGRIYVDAGGAGTVASKPTA